MGENSRSENQLLQQLASQLEASEARLRSIVERSPDAFLIVDREGMVQFVNQAAVSMFGTDESRLIGQPFGLPVISGEKTDIDIITPRGEELIAEMRVVETDWAGKKAYVAVLRDITERSRAEQVLRENAKRLTLAMDVAQLGFWDVELPSGRVIGHEKLLASLGYEPGEIEPRFDARLELIHPDDASRLEQVLQEYLAGNCPVFRADARIRTKSGEWRWMLSQAEVVERTPEGEPLRLIGVTEDITERKHLEESLRRANEELESRIEKRTAELTRSNAALERSNLELQQFAYVAAHDLQTPLRSITGFSQLLYRNYHGRLDAQAEDWLNRLVSASQRMYELIRDVLAYSRVDSRGSALQPTNFSRLFDDVVASLADTIHEARAQVTRDDLPVVMADPSQMAQVLQNLIDNGIKYHGPESPRIHVSAGKRDGEWVFSVRDNGIGIAEKHWERVFDIFHRLHTQQQYPGTGIGLAVCRRVIHRHGGRIWIESEPGRGSTVYFTLPDRGKETESSPGSACRQ